MTHLNPNTNSAQSPTTGQKACPLLGRFLGVKRTWLFALHVAAFDPKRTLLHRFLLAFPVRFASASISLEIKILSDRSSAFAMATAICLMLGLTRI
jgi:hypothetical protein